MNALKKLSRFPILLLTATWFMAFLPVTLFWLGVKNDLFTSYLPPKHFLSASIRAHEFPLWNPFINYGFPMYGDMSMSYWNPSTWLFGLIGYNVYTLTLELILYMLLGGIGMYLLSGTWIRNRDHRLAASLLYMCSGFVTGHLQHFNWISAAGLLPFCIYFYKKFLDEGGTKNFTGALFFLAYWCTSTHPGYVIGLIYILAAMTILRLFRPGNLKSGSLRPLKLFVMLLLVLAGPIAGYLDVIPYTNRSGPMVPDLAEGVTDPSSWISFLFPLAATSENHFLSNDIAMRNCYIGLLPLSALPLLLTGKLKGDAFNFFIAGLFFMAISTSLAGPLYIHLPLINFVRLPGEFILFAVFFFILSGMILLDRAETARMKNNLNILSVFILLALAASAFYILVRKQSVIYASIPEGYDSTRELLKYMLQKISFADKVLLQSLLHFILLRLYLRSMGEKSNLPISILVALECILVTLPNLAYTGVGKRSLHEIDEILGRSPAGPQQPYMAAESTITNAYPYTDPIINNWAFYSKTPAMAGPLLYPLMLRGSAAYFDSGEHEARFRQPFAMLRGQGTVSPEKNTYRYYAFTVRTANRDTLSIKQVGHKGWQARIDGRGTAILGATGSLVDLEIPPGEHRVELWFNRPMMIWALVIHLTVMLGLAALLFRYLIRYIFP